METNDENKEKKDENQPGKDLPPITGKLSIEIDFMQVLKQLNKQNEQKTRTVSEKSKDEDS